ncbi:MAG: radical SAM protein [Chloroflexota bacterium]|nr:radical SAM protein [Chloroflexota bacterium]
MKILLINPNRMKPPVAPIALDYLASALVDEGHAVEVLDLCFSDNPIDDVRRCLASNSISAVAVTLRNTDDTSFATRDFILPWVRRVIDCVRENTDAPVIIGGSGYSVAPEGVLDFCGLDVGVWGEGEHSLPLLVDRITKGEDYRDVQGVVYRDAASYRRVAPRYIDLENRAAPRRQSIDNLRYYMEGGMGGIETKRGCPKACIYCADSLCKGSLMRLRSPSSVADEIETLLGIGVDHLHICDSEFNYPYEHAASVCREIIDRKLGDRVRWYAYCSATPFDEELARMFLQAGCAGVNFGVDSACDRVLQTLGRDFTAADVENTARICHRQGLVFMYDLLLGGPGETRESLRQTIESMKRMSPHRVGASLGVRIYPGTALADMVLGQGPVDINPDIHGAADGLFLEPAFYLSSELGEGAADYLGRLIGGDERFMFMSGDPSDSNYNYNDNNILVDAIKSGYRGAFWDILRRLA